MILAGAALAVLSVVGAQAETYDGVLTIHSVRSRAEVKAEAVTAAHSEDPYAEGAQSHVAALPTNPVARNIVRSDAVATAHGPDRYADGYGQGVTPPTAGSIDRSTVRAEARFAAHNLNLEGK
ncbi:helicase SNF2 [Variovorax sp. J22R133]|uniref:helicase SNF2 n=1 Tax=Variovorax brevis TaxID=3053503 RepID=UPI0025749B28|nr:helicase SNF2 [Variovorax sp. J22R133]MDM0117486.1 helicase SNF2 [Variovorax sp. J22R133]